MEAQAVVVRFTVGGVLRISTAENNVAYGIMLDLRPYMAFYRESAVDLTEVRLREKPMFIVAVHNSSYSKGGWGGIIARISRESLPSIPPFFRQNVMDSSDCDIAYADGTWKKANPGECIGLERISVWSAVHVEKRIDDLCADRPNAWAESMKVKL
jgi:hypothetical protein